MYVILEMIIVISVTFQLNIYFQPLKLISENLINSSDRVKDWL